MQYQSQLLCIGIASGGVLWLENSTLDVKNATFSGNVASGHGGAVYADTDSTLSGSSSAFVNNTAGGCGGAIYQTGFFPNMQGKSRPPPACQCNFDGVCHAFRSISWRSRMS